MEWIKTILENHKNEDGAVDVEAAIKEINKEFPNNAVPKETYNDLAKTKKQLDSDIQERDSQIKEFNEIDVDGLKKEIEGYKLNELKTSIARQAKIPHELAGRLNGTTEEEIKEDAEKLAELVNKKQPLPMKTNEPVVDDKDAGLKKMLENMNAKGE